MVKVLSPADHKRLEAAVAAAEHETSAQLVLAISGISDEYATIPLTWAVVGGIAFAAVLAFVQPDLPMREALAYVGAAILALDILLHWRPLRLMLAPRHAKQHAAARMAHMQFASHVAGRTSHANGLLIFVALAERYVELIPEAGITKVIPASAWEGIVAELLDEVRDGQLVEGLSATVAQCARMLAQPFPHHAGDRNEIPDGVIVTE